VFPLDDGFDSLPYVTHPCGWAAVCIFCDIMYLHVHMSSDLGCLRELCKLDCSRDVSPSRVSQFRVVNGKRHRVQDEVDWLEIGRWCISGDSLINVYDSWYAFHLGAAVGRGTCSAVAGALPCSPSTSSGVSRPRRSGAGLEGGGRHVLEKSGNCARKAKPKHTATAALLYLTGHLSTSNNTSSLFHDHHLTNPAAHYMPAACN